MKKKDFKKILIRAIAKCISVTFEKMLDWVFSLF